MEMKKIWADGSGTGWTAVTIDDEPVKFNHHPDLKSHNEAEYMALIDALQLIHDYETYTVYMDSQLVVRQMNGGYAVRADNLRVLYDKAWKIINERGLCVLLDWIPREKNRAGVLLERMKDGRKGNSA